MNREPMFLLTRPLAWLDEREAESRQWLMEHFGIAITALENTINVISFAIDELGEPVKAFSMGINDLKSEENKSKLKKFVAVALLVEALDSLHATRRLLLSGYFSKMFSCVRTLIEALRSADICKDDETKAVEWLEHREVKKSTKSELHPIVKQLMRYYDFLSQTGTHPMLRSTIVSSLGKPYAFPDTPSMQSEDSEKHTDINEFIGGLIDQLNQFARLFLKYVNENYLIDWDKEPEIKQKRNAILGLGNTSNEIRSQEDAVTLFKAYPGIEPDDTFLDRLSTLFQEPPRMATAMSGEQKNALAQFLEKATVELREMALTGCALGEAQGTRPPLSESEKERGLIGGAFVIGFEMGHDYTLRWGKAF